MDNINEVFINFIKSITNKDIKLYYNPETKEIGEITYFNTKISKPEKSNLIKFPTFEEINHKQIMLSYINNLSDMCIKEKLEKSLTNSSYYNDFMNLISKYKLIDNYNNKTHDLYLNIINIWKKNNNIK